MFTKEDIKQFKRKGILTKQVEEQLEYFRKGFPYIQLVSSAVAGNGILQLDEPGLDKYMRFYESNCQGKSIVKFVPSSGAATRMFKDLLAYLGETESDHQFSPLVLLDKFPEVFNFLDKLQDFPFYPDLQQIATEKNLNLNLLQEQGKVKEIINLLVSEDGLDYGQLPKAVLKFHSYQEGNRTAFGEHLVEAANYASNGSGEVCLHFTVSGQFMKVFADLQELVIDRYQKEFGVRYHIGFSTQDPSTDTVAVDTQNNPFRNSDGQIVFRPGGHGALLKNLNEIDADLVFIKNIDNVAPDSLKPIASLYKKALGGILLDIQSKVFGFLKELERDPGPEVFSGIQRFISDKLGQDPTTVMPQCEEEEELKDKLRCFLNRPIRVCGMVRNEGEPGGGPYWISAGSGHISLQIVEMSQVDRNDPSQEAIVGTSTYFNPVDLVCGIRDYRERKFDLSKYTDPETGFISEKSMDGKTLKALELPGLWNGYQDSGMVRWRTGLRFLWKFRYRPLLLLKQ